METNNPYVKEFTLPSGKKVVMSAPMWRARKQAFQWVKSLKPTEQFASDEEMQSQFIVASCVKIDGVQCNAPSDFDNLNFPDVMKIMSEFTEWEHGLGAVEDDSKN